MKFAVAFVLSALVSQSVFAGALNTRQVDLTKNFEDRRVNLLSDDGILTPVTDLVLPAPANVDFVIGLGGSEAQSSKYLKSCQIQGILKKDGKLMIRLDADLEIDGEGACVVRVRYSNGKHVQVLFEKVGT